MFFWKKSKNINRMDFHKERRLSSRKSCSLSAFILAEDGEYPAKVKNIGVYGLLLESVYPFREREIIKVRIDTDKEPFTSAPSLSDVVVLENVWISKRKTELLYVAGFKVLMSEENSRSWFPFFAAQNDLGFGQELKKRTYIRYPIYIPVYYDSLNGEFEGNAIIKNISVGGLAMITNTVIPRFTNLNLRIGPDRGLPQVIIVGKVCWSALVAGDNKITTGVFFPIPLTEKDPFFRYIELAASEYCNPE